MPDLRLRRPKLWRPPSRRPGPMVASFTPRQIANLVLWLDASDASTITDAGGGAVSAWADKSGVGNNATQATAGFRPLTGTRSQGGKNVIDFDASDDELGSAVSAASRPNTTFLVCMPDRQGSGSGTQPLRGTASAAEMIGEYADTSAKWGWGRMDLTWNQSYDAGVAFAASTAYVLQFAFDTTNVVTRVNGGAEETDSDGGTFTGGGTTIIGPGFRWDGWIGEVLKFTVFLSAADRARVFAYLRQKWGI